MARWPWPGGRMAPWLGGRVGGCGRVAVAVAGWPDGRDLWVGGGGGGGAHLEFDCNFLTADFKQYIKQRFAVPYVPQDCLNKFTIYVPTRNIDLSANSYPHV